MNDLGVLKEFLEIPLGSSDQVFERFSDISGAIIRGEGLRKFL